MVDIYKVGGAVRDQLLGIIPTDNDYVVVGANKEYMLSQGFIEVGRDFPVYLHPKTHEEYALARLERKTGKGHKSFTFETQETVTLKDDLKRRDITINAMALDQNNNLIDPFKGYEDLKNGIIRHVSNSFSEDPLRVLRVARFAAKLNFTIAPETMIIIKDVVNSQELLHLSRERIIEEISKALLTKHIAVFFQTLLNVSAIEQILPQVLPTLKNSSKEFYFALTLFDKYQCSSEERFAILGFYMKDSSFFNKRSNRLSHILLSTIDSIMKIELFNAESILSIISKLDPIRRANDYLIIKKLFTLLAETKNNNNIVKNIEIINQIIIKFHTIDYSRIEPNSEFLQKLTKLKLTIINNTIKGHI